MFLSKEEIDKIGFKSVGENVLISDKASIYSPHTITIGDNVRIDDFVILSVSDDFHIGSYVHIGCYASIIGGGTITLEDFTSISGRVSIYSSNDDYTGLKMTNPMVPSQYTGVKTGPILIKKHSIIGCNCVVLPNTILGEGTSVGSLSLLNGEYEEWGVWTGVPAKRIRNRQKRLLRYEQALRNN
jgi:acetyltransferase-like isoleucine patch superfamily enzyme